MQMYNNKFGGFPLNNAWCRLAVGNVMTPVVFDVKRRLDMLLPFVDFLFDPKKQSLIRWIPDVFVCSFQPSFCQSRAH